MPLMANGSTNSLFIFYADLEFYKVIVRSIRCSTETDEDKNVMMKKDCDVAFVMTTLISPLKRHVKARINIPQYIAKSK